jgi:cytochrome c oxidase subunit 2
MKAHTWEKGFLAASIVVLIGCMAALAWATLGQQHIHLPGVAGQVNPRNLATTPPFDQPGLREVEPGRYEAVVIARIWSFDPPELRVPVGAEITFIATSADVLHGFNVEGTRLNMMLIPGQISRNTYTFEEPGEHLLICHEYCGIGHHTMSGRIIVEGPARTAATENSRKPAS